MPCVHQTIICLASSPFQPFCFFVLQCGLLLGIPIVFDTDRDDIVAGDKILITYKGQNIGALTVESKYVPDKVCSFVATLQRCFNGALIFSSLFCVCAWVCG